METPEKKRTLIDILADSNITPFAIGVVVVVIWFTGSFILYRHYFISHPEWAGQFGDMFGVANSLFSGLAFAGLVYTIILQRKELSLTRDELELTRGEFVKQNATMIQQRFENTFFNMVKLHREVVDTLTIERIVLIGKAETITGKASFKYLFDILGVNRGKVHSYYLNEYLSSVHKTHNIPIDQYFRSLYQVVRLIDEADESINKQSYARIVRAYLTKYELLLLFYNSLSDKSKGIFKPLIEKYALLKNLDKTLLLGDVSHNEDYAPSAYGVI